MSAREPSLAIFWEPPRNSRETSASGRRRAGYGPRMGSFVVETFVAQSDRHRFEDRVRRLEAAAASTLAGPHRVRHVRSYLMPADAMGFHVMEAESAEDVARVTTLANIEVERIGTVITVDSGLVKAPARGRTAPRREGAVKH